MTRRTFLPALAGGSLAMAATPRKGHLKQSACRWCYKDIPIDALARQVADLCDI